MPAAVWGLEVKASATSSTRRRGHGVRTRIQATAQFRRRLEALSPGEVTDPFLSESYDPAKLTYRQTGVFVVRLDALGEPVPQSFEDVLDMVRANYLRRNYQRLVGEVRQQVAEEIGLEVFADRWPPKGPFSRTRFPRPPTHFHRYAP